MAEPGRICEQMTSTFNPPPGEGLAEKLQRWFHSAMRPLPWRRDYEPYHVWISEIMLQQTQMERGVRYFNAWIQRFPDIRSVAEADEEAILAAWEGLGYYSRARNLHAAAKHIVRDHGGVFPHSVEAIRTLPGVGEYTAGAIAAIAFNLPEPAVDANVLRIFARLCDIDKPAADREAKAFVTSAVQALIPPDSPRVFCQALMELGALVCSKIPKCDACPITEHCLALHRGTVGDRPAKGAGTAYSLHESAAGIAFRNSLVFIRKRPPGGLWGGLWEFPGGFIAPGESPEQAALRHIHEATGLPATIREKLPLVRHGYTTRRVTLHGFLCDVGEGCTPKADPAVESAWVRPGEAARYAFPAGQRKLLERLGWK